MEIAVIHTYSYILWFHCYCVSLAGWMWTIMWNWNGYDKWRYQDWKGASFQFNFCAIFGRRYPISLANEWNGKWQRIFSNSWQKRFECPIVVYNFDCMSEYEAIWLHSQHKNGFMDAQFAKLCEIIIFYWMYGEKEPYQRLLYFHSFKLYWSNATDISIIAVLSSHWSYMLTYLSLAFNPMWQSSIWK